MSHVENRSVIRALLNIDLLYEYIVLFEGSYAKSSYVKGHQISVENMSIVGNVMTIT